MTKMKFMIQDQRSGRTHIHIHGQTNAPTTQDQMIPPHEITFHKNIRQRSVMAQNCHVKSKTTTNAPHGDVKMANHYQAMPDYLAVIW